MSALNLNELTKKLTPASKQILEQAINSCLRYQHPSVEIVHLLNCFIEKDPLFQQLLQQLQIKTSDCIDQIKQKLEQLPQQVVDIPTLSHQTIHWLKESWLFDAMQTSAQGLSPYRLLQVLTSESQCLQLLHHILPGFSQIDSQRIATILTQLDNQQPSPTPRATAGHSGQSVIEQYCINLTQQAKTGKIDAAIGREPEIQQVIDILLRRRQNNPLLVGEPGVGKTAIVEGLALAIAHQQVPSQFFDYQILSLDMALLLAGASVKGEFENRLRELINAIRSSPSPCIVFIDEAHTLIGAGNPEGGLDAANLLKPALARGELKTIAATTWSEYKQYFETDAALTRRFQIVKVNEPSDDHAIAMCRSLQSSLEKHHSVIILDEAIRSAVFLSRHHVADRYLPDKAISLLDTACSRVALRQQTKPLSLLEIEQQIQLLKQSIKQHQSHQSLQSNDPALKKMKNALQPLLKKQKQLLCRWEKDQADNQQLSTLLETNDKNTKSKIKQLKKRLKQPACLVPFCVDTQVIKHVIQDWTGIPMNHLQQSKQQKVSECETTLRNTLKGQDHVIDIVMQTVKSIVLQLQDPAKPLGVLFLTGPSGVGKTLLAKTLAKQLFGSTEHMTTINLSEFKEEHKVSMLLGAPPGYVGYGQGGILTEAVRRQPYHIILLDEAEKAHPGVCDVFYQIFDQGEAIDGQGRKINFKNTLFILTCNLGDQLIIEHQHQPIETIEQLIYPRLKQHFNTAFLGRTQIIPFLPLSKTATNDIIQDKLSQLSQRLYQAHQIKIEYNKELIEKVKALSDCTEFGARNIESTLNKMILPRYIEQLLETKTD